jgi:deoxyribodipyrimidine photolyase-related protein
MKTFVLLPTQIFSLNYIPSKKYLYILWEHPYYFKAYNYNKKKLILHRASMQYYKNYLEKNGYQVTYYSFQEIPDIQEADMFFVPDKLTFPWKTNYLESPNFLLTQEHFKAYRKKTEKFFFNAFYMWGKKQINLIPEIKSLDKQNRKTPPKDIHIPPLSKLSQEDKEYVKEASGYVNKYFYKNCGSVESFVFPVTHHTALRFLKDFIKNKFIYFGDYQDFIAEDKLFLFHSCLSTSINIGLLNPKDIIALISDSSVVDFIPLNSYEGYIRQLFWREYQLYCYRYYDFSKKNYFGNTKKITQSWYKGTLGVPPVDDAIKYAFKFGYLHHIQRLMVIGNFMNLSGIDPKEGYRWFMEFSCDSYDWVMEQNVYDMVFFVSGGATMRRPYVSSSNYILKMSNYKKGQWCKVWDMLYRSFLQKNRAKLFKFRYYFRGL